MPTVNGTPRITPTYMGNTISIANQRGHLKDHPHIHGEYRIKRRYEAMFRGSPPHTWGILHCWRGYCLSIKDHPHIHGEYYDPEEAIENGKGSPPHTWGIHHRVPVISGMVGITPTYMGNTLAIIEQPAALQDHPHIHGEYSLAKLMIDCVVGSPPHTWGILEDVDKILAHPRITPTYMGWA